MNQNRMKHSYTVIVDHDVRIDKWGWSEAYEKAVTAALEGLGFKVTDVISHPSASGRGVKYWFHLLSPRQLSDGELNMLNFIAGDDRTRVRINRLRVRRGLRHMWNKSFAVARTLRKPRCAKCKLVRVLKEMEATGGEETRT